MNVTILGVDKIKEVKVLASLQNVFGTRIGGDMTRAGGYMTLFYAVDEETTSNIPRYLAIYPLSKI